MEEQLDLIAKEKYEDKLVYLNCFETLNKLTNSPSMKKKEYKIDDNHFYIIGKYGPVIKEVDSNSLSKDAYRFKAVIKDVDTGKLEAGYYTLQDLLVDSDSINEKKRTDMIGKYNGYDLRLKKGKYGLYAEWGENRQSLSKQFGNRPLDNISYDEVTQCLDIHGQEQSNEAQVHVPISVNENISIRNGKYGDYIFYKTMKMKKPAFYKLTGYAGNYTDKQSLLKWISDTYYIC